MTKKEYLTLCLLIEQYFKNYSIIFLFFTLLFASLPLTAYMIECCEYYYEYEVYQRTNAILNNIMYLCTPMVFFSYVFYVIEGAKNTSRRKNLTLVAEAYKKGKTLEETLVEKELKKLFEGNIND